VAVGQVDVKDGKGQGGIARVRAVEWRRRIEEWMRWASSNLAISKADGLMSLWLKSWLR
jgi:hypothetical protein